MKVRQLKQSKVYKNLVVVLLILIVCIIVSDSIYADTVYFVDEMNPESISYGDSIHINQGGASVTTEDTSVYTSEAKIFTQNSVTYMGDVIVEGSVIKSINNRNPTADAGGEQVTNPQQVTGGNRFTTQFGNYLIESGNGTKETTQFLWQPSHRDLTLMQEYISNKYQLAVTTIDYFDLKDIWQENDIIGGTSIKDVQKRREFNILGYDILMESEYFEALPKVPNDPRPQYAYKAYNKFDDNAPVRKSLAVMATYKTLNNPIYKIICVRTDHKENARQKYLKMTNSNLLKYITFAPSCILAENYYTNVFTTRTLPDIYWREALLDGLVGSSYFANGSDTSTTRMQASNRSDNIHVVGFNDEFKELSEEAKGTLTIAEFCELVMGKMYLEGEPELTEEEEKQLLVVYGKALPYYLSANKLKAVKYLMCRGIISDNLNFNDELTQGLMLEILMRVKDIDSRLVFRNIDIDYNSELVDLGYFPAQLSSESESVFNLGYKINSDFREYRDYFVEVCPETTFTHTNGGEVQTVFIANAPVDSSGNVSKLEGANYIGQESINGRLFYHFVIKATAVGNPIDKPPPKYDEKLDTTRPLTGNDVFYIETYNPADYPKYIQLTRSWGGGVFTREQIVKGKATLDTSMSSKEAQDIPTMYGYLFDSYGTSYKWNYIDSQRALRYAEDPAFNEEQYLNNSFVYKFTTTAPDKVKYDKRTLQEIINNENIENEEQENTQCRLVNTYTLNNGETAYQYEIVESFKQGDGIGVDPIQHFNEKLIVEGLEQSNDWQKKLDIDTVYIKENDSIFVSFNWLKAKNLITKIEPLSMFNRNEVKDSEKDTTIETANSIDTSKESWLLTGTTENIIVDCENKLLIRGQIVEELDDLSSPLIVKSNDDKIQYLIDYKVVKGIANDLCIVSSQQGLSSVNSIITSQTDLITGVSEDKSKDVKAPYFQVTNILQAFSEETDSPVYMRANSTTGEILLESTYPLSNWLIYRKKNSASFSGEFLIAFNPKYEYLEESEEIKKIYEEKDKYKAEVEKDFNIKVGNKEFVNVFNLERSTKTVTTADESTKLNYIKNLQDVDKEERLQRVSSELKGNQSYTDVGSCKLFIYKPPTLEEFNYIKYLKGEQNILPFIKREFNDKVEFVDLNINHIIGESLGTIYIKNSPWRNDTSFSNSTKIKLNLEEKDGYEKVIEPYAVTEIENINKSKDTINMVTSFGIEPTVVGIQSMYYRYANALEASFLSHVQKLGEKSSINNNYKLYFGTMGIRYMYENDKHKFILPSTMASLEFASQSKQAGKNNYIPLDFHEVFRGENNYIYVASRSDTSSLVNFVKTTETPNREIVDIRFGLGHRNNFDWGNFKIQSTATNLEDFITICTIFVLNIFPRILLVDLFILAILSLIAKYPVTEFICSRFVDIYKVLSFGLVTHQTVSISRIWVSLTMATILLSTLQNGVILDVIEWLMRVTLQFLDSLIG